MKRVAFALGLIFITQAALADDLHWTKAGGRAEDFYTVRYQCIKEFPQQPVVYPNTPNAGLMQLIDMKERENGVAACLNAHGWFLR